MDKDAVGCTAIAALLVEARNKGVDINDISQAAKNGLLDAGKEYRWANPVVACDAIKAIDHALKMIDKE